LPTQETLIAFAAVSAAIMVVPGPANLFILTQGAAHGRRRALAATGGIELASGIRVLLTAAGLSTLLASSALAFSVIRWAGVAYLVCLGAGCLRTAPSQLTNQTVTGSSSCVGATRKGVIVGLGNPKTIMFFLSFVPQFIHHDRGSHVEQILVLGAVWWIIGASWDLALAWASGSLGSWLRTRPRIQAAHQRAEGLIYLALAGWCAVTGG
jgi:threonine/homoserine/homoserine lactone efflux protein